MDPSIGPLQEEPRESQSVCQLGNLPEQHNHGLVKNTDLNELRVSCLSRCRTVYFLES